MSPSPSREHWNIGTHGRVDLKHDGHRYLSIRPSRNRILETKPNELRQGVPFRPEHLSQAVAKATGLAICPAASPTI